MWPRGETRELTYYHLVVPPPNLMKTTAVPKTGRPADPLGLCRMLMTIEVSMARGRKAGTTHEGLTIPTLEGCQDRVVVEETHNRITGDRHLTEEGPRRLVLVDTTREAPRNSLKRSEQNV